LLLCFGGSVEISMKKLLSHMTECSTEEGHPLQTIHEKPIKFRLKEYLEGYLLHCMETTWSHVVQVSVMSHANYG
jgi:hypothetical protein